MGPVAGCWVHVLTAAHARHRMCGRVSEALRMALSRKHVPGRMHPCCEPLLGMHIRIVILCREEPLSVSMGLSIEEHDQEGRVITAEYPEFYGTRFP